MNLANLALEQLRKGTPLNNLTLDGIVHVKAHGNPPKNLQAPIASETELFTQNTPYVANIGRINTISGQIFNLTKEQPVADKVIEANGAYLRSA